MTFLKLLGLAVLAGPLMVAKTGLTPDGSKYLAEAQKRIAAVEKNIAAAKTDPVKADAAKDDLLASKRFLDNVQAEQPKNTQAAALQKKADGLLAQIKPTLLKVAIADRLVNIEELTTIIEKELAMTGRELAADEKLRDHFDMLRQMVREVLEKEPANTKALAFRDKENALWDRYQQQREAKKGATP
jgi:hypothetical protein